MRKLAPSRPVVLFLLASAASVALVFGACANPDTLTPTCTNNVGPNGINQTVANGCELVAPCDKGAAALCCTAPDGGALAANDFNACLHGYGDPTCSYLVNTPYDGGVILTCSPTAPGDAGGGG